METQPFDLEREWEAAEQALAAPGAPTRHARTLYKNGALRVLLIAFAPGGTMAEHTAQGPITVQGVRGVVRFQVDDTVHVLRAGNLLVLPAKVPHALASVEGGAVLVTIALPA